MKTRLPFVLACALLLLACQLPSVISSQPPTATPEVILPANQGVPDYGITLEGVHLLIAGATLSDGFPAGCTGGAPCTMARAGSRILSVTFTPEKLPEGSMLAYKNMPAVRVSPDGGDPVRYTLTLYDNASSTLTLGFEVPGTARSFGLHWGDMTEIPITVQP